MRWTGLLSSHQSQGSWKVGKSRALKPSNFPTVSLMRDERSRRGARPDAPEGMRLSSLRWTAAHPWGRCIVPPEAKRRSPLRPTDAPPYALPALPLERILCAMSASVSCRRMDASTACAPLRPNRASPCACSIPVHLFSPFGFGCEGCHRGGTAPLIAHPPHPMPLKRCFCLLFRAAGSTSHALFSGVP